MLILSTERFNASRIKELQPGKRLERWSKTGNYICDLLPPAIINQLPTQERARKWLEEQGKL
jgi:hypothetical protein